jgi:uncharacterized protein
MSRQLQNTCLVLSLFLCFGCTVEEASPALEVDAAMVEVDAFAAEALEVKVATFNVKQFFDTNCDSGRCTAQSFELLPTSSEFDAKSRQLVQGITSLNADVVLLQEIETELCLNALKELLGDRYQTAFLGETNGSASLDVGVLSTLPLLQTVSHQDDTIPLIGQQGNTYFTRDLLEVHLDLEGELLIVFSAHFRSKYPPDDPAQRLAEASAARDIVTVAAQSNPEALVVLGGDLNDVPGSAPINALEDGGSLQRIASELGAEAATYIYRGQGQAIDHLYFARNGSGAYVPGSARVIRNSERGLAGSDHSALLGTFSIVPGSGGAQ